MINAGILVFLTILPEVLPKKTSSFIELLLGPTTIRSIPNSLSTEVILSITLPLAEINFTSTFFLSTVFIIARIYKLVSRSIIPSTFIMVPAFVCTLYALKTKTFASISAAKLIAYCNVFDAFSVEPMGTKICFICKKIILLQRYSFLNYSLF